MELRFPFLLRQLTRSSRLKTIYKGCQSFRNVVPKIEKRGASPDASCAAAKVLEQSGTNQFVHRTPPENSKRIEVQNIDGGISSAPVSRAEMCRVVNPGIPFIDPLVLRTYFLPAARFCCNCSTTWRKKVSWP